MTNQPINLKDKILKEIELHKTKPRSIFIFQTTLLGFAMVFLLGLAFYLFAFTIFILNENGVLYAPLMGGKGFKVLFFSLPWTLLVIAMSSMVVASVLSKHFEISYKKPLLITLLGIVVTIVVSHVIFVTTGAQEVLKKEAFRRGIPLAPESLRQMRENDHPRFIEGKVIGTTSESVIIDTGRGRTFEYTIKQLDPNETINLNTLEIMQKVQIIDESGEKTRRRPPNMQAPLERNIAPQAL